MLIIVLAVADRPWLRVFLNVPMQMRVVSASNWNHAVGKILLTNRGGGSNTSQGFTCTDPFFSTRRGRAGASQPENQTLRTSSGLCVMGVRVRFING